MVVVYIILSYLALYLVIWLHEVGHAVMYKKYGCKQNAFHVTVPFYLFFSTPATVDVEKLQQLSNKQNYHIGIAGIITNLMFGIPLFLYFYFVDGIEPNPINYFLLLFAILHLVEAITYLTASNILLSSDMLLVDRYKPSLRIPYFLLGLLVLVLAILLIMNSPDAWRNSFIIISVVTVASMVGGRVLFTMRRTN